MLVPRGLGCSRGDRTNKYIVVWEYTVMSHCELGFVLELASTPQDLRDACTVRAQAYGHHLPEMGERLAEPDELDFAAGTAVFLCRDKADGRAVGTMRIQSSSAGPLWMESSLSLPAWLRSRSRAEVTRLAVCVGADPLIRVSLWKASYLYCMANGVDWMVVGARNEALIRNYKRLGFIDVFGPGELMPLAHTGGLPHRIMAFENLTAERRWSEARHPLYRFVFETHHADLAACSAPRDPARPRGRQGPSGRPLHPVPA
jgi:hypothetical protein